MRVIPVVFRMFVPGARTKGGCLGTWGHVTYTESMT